MWEVLHNQLSLNIILTKSILQLGKIQVLSRFPTKSSQYTAVQSNCHISIHITMRIFRSICSSHEYDDELSIE